MVDQETSLSPRLKWVALGCVGIIVLAVALFIVSLNRVEESPVTESAGALQQVVTQDMYDALDRRIYELDSKTSSLSKKMQGLHAQHAAVESFMARQGGEVRDLQERVTRINTELPELVLRLDEVDARLLELKQAAEAAESRIAEPVLRDAEPARISRLMNWGGQELAIVKTPAGYQALGTGDQVSGWQIVRIELAEGQVLLRHLESGREVVQSFGKKQELRDE
jgi:uncharacterized coiled-coil protein SlyX